MALTAAFAAALVLFSNNVRTVVIDDGNREISVKTVTGDIEDAAGKIGLKSGSYNVLATEKKNGKTVALIEKTFPVTITAGDKTLKVITGSAKVSDILQLAGLKVDEHDLVEPALNTLINKKSSIDYIDIEYVTEECTEVIPYDVKTVFTNTLSSGSSYSTEGSNGLKLVNYAKKYVNGVEAEKTVISEQIITGAVKRVNTVGTRGNENISTGVAVTTSSNTNCYSTVASPYDIPLDENGVPTQYTSHVTVEATAYTYTGHNMSTGTTPQPGYVAVNPNIIPYHTKMYIVSSDGNWVYGYAEAKDTGGFAYSRPTNIDLFFETYAQCIAFGRRNIEVYFLP